MTYRDRDRLCRTMRVARRGNPPSCWAHWSGQGFIRRGSGGPPPPAGLPFPPRSRWRPGLHFQQAIPGAAGTSTADKAPGDGRGSPVGRTSGGGRGSPSCRGSPPAGLPGTTRAFPSCRACANAHGRGFHRRQGSRGARCSPLFRAPGRRSGPSPPAGPPGGARGSPSCWAPGDDRCSPS